jgi:hypothetical protein
MDDLLKSAGSATRSWLAARARAQVKVGVDEPLVAARRGCNGPVDVDWGFEQQEPTLAELYGQRSPPVLKCGYCMNRSYS